MPTGCFSVIGPVPQLIWMIFLYFKQKAPALVKMILQGLFKNSLKHVGFVERIEMEMARAARGKVVDLPLQ